MTTADPERAAATIGGGTWTIDRNHSLIEFAGRHFGIAHVKAALPAFLEPSRSTKL
jgi:polyisoprenoid-binding protein YceI